MTALKHRQTSDLAALIDDLARPACNVLLEPYAIPYSRSPVFRASHKEKVIRADRDARNGCCVLGQVTNKITLRTSMQSFAATCSYRTFPRQLRGYKSAKFWHWFSIVIEIYSIQ